MIIPDVLSIGGMFAGVLLSLFVPEIHGFSSGSLHAHPRRIEALLGVLSVRVNLLIATLGELLLKKPAMGEGDMNSWPLSELHWLARCSLALFGGPLLELSLFYLGCSGGRSKNPKSRGTRITFWALPSRLGGAPLSLCQFYG